MTRDVQLLLVGASISLISSIVTLLLQHFLTLRLDKVKRERDKIDRDILELKERLYKTVDLETINKLRGTFHAFESGDESNDVEILVSAIAQELINRKIKEITAPQSQETMK